MLKIKKDWFIVLINLVLQFLLIVVYLPFAIGFSKYGLIIGGAFGLICSCLNTLLILKGSSLLLMIDPSTGENPKTTGNKGYFILFYFIRVIVTVGFLIMTIVFYYALHIEVFKYSFIPLLVSLTSIIGVIPLGDFLYKKLIKNQNVTELKLEKKKSNENSKELETSNNELPQEENKNSGDNEGEKNEVSN